MSIKILLETINDAEQHVNDLKDKYWILLHHVSFTPKYKKKKPIKIIRNIKTETKNSSIQYYENEKLYCIVFKHEETKCSFTPKYKKKKPAKPVFVLKNKSIGEINIVQNYVKYYEHGILECELNRNHFTFYHENGTIDVDYDSSGQMSSYRDDGTLYYIGTCVLLDYDVVVKRVSDNEFYSDDEFIFVKGKQYSNGKLCFEGEYEGCLCKKGKQYYSNGQLKYEGEWETYKYYGYGLGKEYYSNGQLKYEGEYEEGEYKKGKEYYENGQLKYANDGVHTIAYYPDHKKIRIKHTNCLGKEYYETEELKYEGEFKGQFREGQGKEYYETGELKYEGEWVKDKYERLGKVYYENGNIKFDGSWCGGNFIEGKYYVGVFLYEGKFSGKGKFYINNELAYYGHWKDHKRHGLGKKYYVNEIKYAHRQTEYDGEWVNDVRKGKGKEYDKNGRLTYDGEWVNDVRKGKGKEYDKNGRLTYDGEWWNNVRKGKGKEYDKNGNLIYDGEWWNNDRKGKGKEYDKNGNLIYDGEWGTWGRRKDNTG
jgi:antitoxin component YwqK of YwqJK toxin-antitoxin module